MNRIPQDTLDRVPVDEMLRQTGTDSLSVDTAAPGRPSFSVWRILQSLPECATPVQQDSAVQANLPMRERFLSDRPDTLGIPGIEARSPYRTVADFPAFYCESFFSDSRFWQTEVSANTLGMEADLLPYMLRRDDWVTGVLLVCFFFLILVISNGKRYFQQQLKNFFFATRSADVFVAVETGSEKRHMAFLICQTSLVFGVLFFDYVLDTFDVFLGWLSPHLLLGVYAAVCLLYFGVKRLLYGFVNWIFFDRFRRMKWTRSNSLVLALEGTLLFPLALVTVYFDMPLRNVALCFLLGLACLKILLFYKAFVIFFRKIHGFLHLIVYFCALEIMPLLALWKMLMYITDNLIIKQ